MSIKSKICSGLILCSSIAGGWLTSDVLQPYLPTPMATKPKITFFRDVNGDGLSDYIEGRGIIFPTFKVYLSKVRIEEGKRVVVLGDNRRRILENDYIIYLFRLPSLE